MGPGGFFFPTDPYIVDVLGDTVFDCENSHFVFDVLDSKYLDFQVPIFWISRVHNSGLSDFPNSGFLDCPTSGFVNASR